MSNRITVEVGSVWERKKGHGWLRKVVSVYNMGGKDWCIYKSNNGDGWVVKIIELDGELIDAAISVCTVDAMKRWGKRV
jgi:hypothetical protein